MIPKEVLKNVRRIQIATSRMVTDAFAGQYQSVFKGKGMEFEEVREYLPGDEIRSIDWNVTARMGHPYVKKFTEERELTVMLLLDKSASCLFGTSVQQKSRLAAELCAVLAFCAIKNNDKVGFIAFTDKVERFIPPRKGVSHVLRVVRDALYAVPQGRGTDISAVLEYVNRVTTRRAVVFLISDFYAPGYKKALAIANKRHDIVALTITDPRELSLPEVGVVMLDDPETQKQFMLDTSSAAVRKEYALRAQKRAKDRDMVFRAAGVDSIELRTDKAYAQELSRFFKKREKRMR